MQVSQARRFETGSWNMAGTLALGQSLDLLEEVGIGEVWASIEALNTQLAEGLESLGFTIESPRGQGERSGILAFSRPGLDPEALRERLEKHKIIVSARRGWIRAAPHFYNQPGQIEWLLEVLKH